MKKTWLQFARYFIDRISSQWQNRGFLAHNGALFLKLAIPTTRRLLILEAIQEYCETTYPNGVPANERIRLPLGWLD